MKQKETLKNCFAVIPALNESKAIEKTLIEVLKYISKNKILVVDNGSNDGTIEISRKLGVNVIREPKRGKGYALRRGFKYIPKNTSAIFIVDADDTYSISQLPRAVELVVENNIDMVIGYRVEKKYTSRKPAFKFGHKFGNVMISSISRVLNPIGIKDTLSGWRVLSPAFIRSFTGGATGFEIESELNAHAFFLQVDIFNLPIEYRGRRQNSSSKIKSFEDGFKIIKMSFYLFRNNRPLVAYLSLSVPFMTSGAFFIVRAFSDYFKTGLVPKFPSLMVGISTVILGILLIITGLILEKIKGIRSNLAQMAYRGFF
jgi:glycosyltransferase involved in cell wall biosynthesis